tara:strand:- start:5770 stop:5955 length:186 start_codon:yes stop_codon:yes gene_type:complete
VKAITSIMRALCLVAFGANIVVMAFAWTFDNPQLFLLGGGSALLVLFGYLFGYAEDKETEE